MRLYAKIRKLSQLKAVEAAVELSDARIIKRLPRAVIVRTAKGKGCNPSHYAQKVAALDLGDKLSGLSNSQRMTAMNRHANNFRKNIWTVTDSATKEKIPGSLYDEAKN